MAYSGLDNTTTTDMAYWIPEVWAKLAYEEAKSQMYWNRFSGPEGSGMPVVIKSELLTEAGDIINISQVANLTGAGVTGESTLRGNEEQLSLKQVQVTPEWARHAVSSNEKAMKQITQDFRMKAKAGLSYWMAKKMDASMWTAARSAENVGFEATTIAIVYGNDATSLDTLDSADVFGMAEIRKAAAKLAANDTQKVSIPGMSAGDGYYLCFIHPFQGYDLKADSEWISNHRDAAVVGPGNPLFTGALGVVDGVIIHETTQATLVDNANSPAISTSEAVMVGKEALCRGLNTDIAWTEQVDDYEFETGIAIRAAWEDKVLSQKGIVQIITAAIDPSS